MANAKESITSPVGRFVGGSVYKPNTTDAEGRPLVVKNGPNKGQPRVDYYVALAIPKGGEPHWAHTPWGAKIWAVGNAAFPNIAQSPAFAWKVVDGDSQIPNRNGKKPCDNEGWRGHWVIRLSGGFAPKVYRQENGGFVQVMEPDFCKPGHYMEVSFTVEGNGSAQQPGVYLNHSMICHRAFGPEIVFGPDVNSAGFGQGALPAGASPVPLASAIPMPVAALAVMPPPAMPVAPPAIPVAPVAGFVQLPPPAMVPQQAPAFPVPGAVPAVPGLPTQSNVNPAFASPATTSPSNPPPMPPARTMTAAAQGASYAQMIAAGWTDALLIQNGMMLP